MHRPTPFSSNRDPDRRTLDTISLDESWSAIRYEAPDRAETALEKALEAELVGDRPDALDAYADDYPDGYADSYADDPDSRAEGRAGRGGRGLGQLAGSLALLSVGSAATVALLLVWNVMAAGGKLAAWLSAPFTTPQPPPQVDLRSLAVDRIRGASELTTVVYGMEAIVPSRRDRAIGNWTVGSTKLLYIAYGEVRAGVDLARVQPGDVVQGDAGLSVRLPPPQILDRKIDVGRSTTYDYDRGFLALGPDAAPELVALAQREALQKVTEAACDRGILDEASERAQTAVAQLLAADSLGSVTVTVQPPAPDACAIAPEAAPPAGASPQDRETAPAPLPPAGAIAP